MSICSRWRRCSLPVFAAALLIAGCSSSPRFATRDSADPERAPKPATPAVSESPKTIRNPAGKVLLTLEGIASYYADQYHGKLTSNGETFDMNDLTAAHRTFPFGSKVRVTNLENKRNVVVRINDRGPFIEGRIIDLALAAAKELELIRTGTVRVKLEVLEWGDGK